MQSRHVRAVAVFGIAVFALTGARGSGGGGCSGGSSSSSSSSSSSGGSDSGSSSTTGGSSTTTGTGGSSGSRGAARDLKIETCAYDSGLVARVRATNSSSTSIYSYEFDVEFTDTNGQLIDTVEDNVITAVPAGSSATFDVKVPQSTLDAGGHTVGGGTCKLADLERTAA
ncbi:FxLYD domain-containing protein [Streptomyces brasiliscabiei]|uniref:FxLYD domain-containing protein n=1 Tax=Streptomyces brasiliscabiei TaxID=2736302 RepID=UPI001C11A636|nr:FxLYD domain-containing protein [Streptomyces brasiliscabiei]